MRSLLAVSILIVLFAVATPGMLKRHLDAPASAEAAVSEDIASAPAAEAAQSSARQVSIRAAGDGHFYVDADINFRPVRLIVDTGATAVALRESDAAEAGIRVNRSDFVNPVQTANGTTMAAETVLSSISVNDIEVRNVRALIVPDAQLSVSLLGGSFLHGLARFEVTDGTLIFEN